jgi:AraC family transcriptional activator of pobA
MEKELPKIELPEEWLIGTGINKELLSLYTNFPCRLKSEIFVLCMDGEIEASVNLNHISVRANDFVTLMPGSIFQIHSVEGNLKIYFGGFSSSYIEQANLDLSVLKTLFITLGRPVFSLKPEGAKLMEEYFCFLIKLYEFFNEDARKMITPYLYNNIHAGISAIYKTRQDTKCVLSKSEQICKNFAQLVMQKYNETRNVSWYAQKLGITHAHLCTTVKQVTGNTCIEIISRMVIMDAKSQLKSTSLSIQEISDSLNFANMSFFGKYFKRYVGMSPLEYRNNG